MTSRVHKHRFPGPAFLVALTLATGLFVPFFSGTPGSRALVGGVSPSAAPHSPFAIGAPVELLAQPHLVLERGTLSLVANRGSESVAGTEGAARGREHLVLDDAMLSLNVAPVPAAAAASAGRRDAVAPLLAALVDGRFETVRLRHATLLLHGNGQAIAELVNVDAEIARRDAALRATGTFSFRGEPVPFSATLYPPSAGANDGKRRAAFGIDSHMITARVEGYMLALDGLKLMADSAILTVPSLEAAAQWLGVPWPSKRQAQSAGAQGKLRWSDEALAFEDAAIEIDGNRGRGNLTLRFPGGRPEIEGTLAFDHLDITRYLAGEWGGDEPPETSPFAAPGGNGSTSADTSLEAFDADLRLSVEHVVAHGARLGSGATTLSLKDGRLLADVAEFGTGLGATGGGQLSLDTTGAEPRLSLKGKVEALDAGYATRALFGYPVLEGRLNATVDLTAEGAWGDRLVSTLSGKVAVELPEAGELGIDAGVWVSPPPGGAPGQGWGNAALGRTPVDWLLGQFTIESGVATAQTVMAGARTKQISAQGTVNLVLRAVDLQLSATPRPGAAEAGTSTPDASFKIEGTWSRPTLRAVDPITPRIRSDHPAGKAVPGIPPGRG